MWPRRLPPHTLSEGVFPLRCLAIAFGAKQVRTRELKEPGEFTCSQCGFYIGFYYDAPGGVTVEVSTMTIAEPA